MRINLSSQFDILKIAILFSVFMVFISSCSTPKKVPPKPATTITKQDVRNGGTSYSNAVMIAVTTESDGIAEEFKWLKNLYPGYTLIRKTQATRSSRNYDIIRIKTRGGVLKDVYFDTTSFSGR